MKVVDHQPIDWFLLKSDMNYYLDVNCSRSFFGFSVSILLTTEEVGYFERDSRKYIQELANQVSEKSDPSHPRNIRDNEILNEIHSSIMEWKKETGN